VFHETATANTRRRRHNWPLVEALAATRRPRAALAARVDAIEGATSAVRERILSAIGLRRDARAVHRHPLDRARVDVHHAARDVYALWRDGGDLDEAMGRLGRTLSVAAEFDA
jgi:hypothetical protein